ncbi:MAG: class I SAM-dependent methyltransferase [Deltaproteobacteria bacterium]|nr:class I SAM-dependent methyltransferase [Deltaproteobacteria bacterium]
MTESSGTNAEQIAYWNEVSGPKWVSLTDRINDQIEPLGRAAMDRASVASGESVLDVGCGCGQTSLALAERVGEGGRVLGVDISEPMLVDAHARVERAGVGQVEYVRADGQVHDFESAAFDLLFSRFGVMFFEDPRAAFANLRGALRPAGRLTFICWQAITKNPWMLIPAAATAQHVELPAPAESTAPGPFAFADADRVVDILESAGFSDVRAEAHEGRLSVGKGLPLAEIVSFLQQMGPAGAALREADASVIEAVTKSMHEALSPHYEDGAVVMDFGAWILTASNTA